MKLGIQVASAYDSKTKTAGFVYELNLMESGKILAQKSLKIEDGAFSCSNQDDASLKLGKILQKLIDKTKEEYDVDQLIVFYKNNGSLEKAIKKDNIDVRFKNQFNPKYFSSKMVKVFGKIRNFNQNEQKPTIEKTAVRNIQKTEEPIKNRISSTPLVSTLGNTKKTEQKTNNKVNVSKAQVTGNVQGALSQDRKHRKYPPIDNFKKKDRSIQNITIEDFVESMVAQESMQQELFKNKISSMSDEDNEVFIDFSFTLEKKRKRTGVMIEYFNSASKLKKGKNCFHKYESIGHGEINCAMYKIKKQLKENAEELLAQGKKVTFNVDLRSEYHRNSFEEFLEKSDLKNKVSVIEHQTPLYNKTFQKLRHKINKDIDIYLRELKKPETVAVFTDGSVNQSKDTSGSGVVIRHQERNKLLASRNPGNPDTTYAEFKAIALACREVATNPEYKGKKIIIVSDNDLMSYSIRNQLNNVGNRIDRPYLDEICELIKENNMNIYFHNVKSHIHENIEPEDEDFLYDFKYNNVVDLVAKAGADMKLSKKDELIISEDTEHDPKYRDKDYSQPANKKTDEEKRLKRFKNAKQKQTSKSKEDAKQNRKRKGKWNSSKH